MTVEYGARRQPGSSLIPIALIEGLRLQQPIRKKSQILRQKDGITKVMADFTPKPS